MYQKLFEQYDMDRDGFITMDENLEQDKVMAEDQGKPFDEVWRDFQLIIWPNLLICFWCWFLLIPCWVWVFNLRITHGSPLKEPI
jgi:hypothetical protein